MMSTTFCDTMTQRDSMTFQVLYADTMHMSPKSNGYGHIAHGRCGMTSWMEGRPLKNEDGKSIANWLFEDIICRWGCITEIVTIMVDLTGQL